MVCELRPPLGSRKDKSSPLSGRYNRWQQGNSPRHPSGHSKRVEPLHRGTPSLEFRCTQSSGSQGCILSPKASCPHIRIPLALVDEMEASELSPINQRLSSALPVWALRCRDLVRLLWSGLRARFAKLRPFRAILRVLQRGFSAVQTAWRRAWDSNLRYLFCRRLRATFVQHTDSATRLLRRICVSTESRNQPLFLFHRKANPWRLWGRKSNVFGVLSTAKLART
jgi:hypothetical protein